MKKKQLPKIIKDTQKFMQEARTEGNLLLRKKIDEFIVLAEKDKSFFIETRIKLISELNKIDKELIKNEGALLILKKLLEDK